MDEKRNKVAEMAIFTVIVFVIVSFLYSSMLTWRNEKLKTAVYQEVTYIGGGYYYRCINGKNQLLQDNYDVINKENINISFNNNESCVAKYFTRDQETNLKKVKSFIQITDIQ